MKDIITSLGSLIPFLEPYPLWVKILSASWIIFSAILLIVLLFAPRSQKDVTKETGLPPAPSQTTGEKRLSEKDQQPLKEFPLSLLDYHSKIEAFGDRFLEREEFLAKLKGIEVVWKGYVYDIRKNEDNQMILVIANTPTLESLTKSAGVTFTSDMETKLFSLRKADFISVRGVLILPETSCPILKGLSIERATETKDTKK